MSAVSRHVFCSLATGEIVRTLAADHDVGVVHVPEGEVAFESPDATAATHYGDGTDLLAYTAEQAVRKATVPAYPALWSNESFGWVDLRTFDGLRDAAAYAVTKQMERAETSQVRPMRDHAALALIALPTPEQVAARELEAAHLVAAYTLMQQLRTKLAAINAASTETELDAASALPPT